MDAVSFHSDPSQHQVCAGQAVGTGIERSDGRKMFLILAIAVGSSELVPPRVSAKVSAGRCGTEVAERVCVPEQRGPQLP